MTRLAHILFLALLWGLIPTANAQQPRDYTLSVERPFQIATYEGLDANAWAQKFIELARSERGISQQAYKYDPEDLESMRLYIWSRLDDDKVDINRVLDLYDQKARALEDNRNIKIAEMTRDFLDIKTSGLSGDEVVDAVSNITIKHAGDTDWFVVFFANTLNFEAHYLGGQGVSSNYSSFAQFILKGQESDLDYDEARLSYLALKGYEFLRNRDLKGYYTTLEETNTLKGQFGLPRSHFADLINAANLHYEIFTDPAAINIAEEAFLNDDLSTDNQESAKYVLGTLYTANGFADKALEVYGSIDLAKFEEAPGFVHAIKTDQALNHTLLGNDAEAAELIADLKANPVSDGYFDAQISLDLLDIISHDQIVTAELKADILKARRTAYNVVTLTKLESGFVAFDDPMISAGTTSNIDTAPAMITGDVGNLIELTNIDYARIQTFIDLAQYRLGNLTSVSSRDQFLHTALEAVTRQDNQALAKTISEYRQSSGSDNDVVSLFEAYANKDSSVEVSDKPLTQAVLSLIAARDCLARGDYACSWEQYYDVEKQSRRSSNLPFIEFALRSLKLELTARENNTAKTLKQATEILEAYGDYLGSSEQVYGIINQVGTCFERAGLSSLAHRMVSLDGKAGMGQPYANHLTEIRLLLTQGKFRSARDRLDVLILENGPVRQTVYEKALGYTAYAALGETEQAQKLAQQVRAGSRGLKDSKLDALIEPNLLLGDYYLNAHLRPFEAEAYRLRYVEARKLGEFAQKNQIQSLVQARLRAENAAETRQLSVAQSQLAASRSKQTSLGAVSAISLGLLALAGFFLAGLRRRNKSLIAKNQQLDHKQKTQSFYLSEMERQTSLETAALSSAVDTIARTPNADSGLLQEKVSGHAGNLTRIVSSLMFQNQVFSGQLAAPVKTRLPDLRQELMGHWQAIASQKDISILFDIDEPVSIVRTHKNLLREALDVFVRHSITHTSCDVITIKMSPFKLGDQSYVKTVISDEGDGLADFDGYLGDGDLSPESPLLNPENAERFAASTAIMAINNAGGRFESVPSPGFGHTLGFDMPANLLGETTQTQMPANIVPFKKESSNDG